MSKKISSRLAAVAFVAALTFAGTAQAGPLASGTESGNEAPSWSLAWNWLIEVWGDLTGMDVVTTTDSAPTGGTTQGGGDVGCGIDPNGTCGG